ncbi:MAG: glycosyltransferase [Nitrososphaeria archaeon]
MKQYSVIIPTLNEEKGLELILPKLKKLGYDSIVIVDADSTDHTVDVALKYGAKVVKQVGIGLVAAELQGMGSVDADRYIVMDGDGQHRPEDIPSLLKSNADLVIGARIQRDDTAFRRLVSAGAKWLARTGLQDPTSGFRVYSRRAARYLIQQGIKHHDYLGQIEIIKKLQKAGFTVEERPISFAKRVGGKSHLSPLVILQYLFASLSGFE